MSFSFANSTLTGYLYSRVYSAVGWVAAPSQPNEIGECWVAKKTATQPTLLNVATGYIPRRAFVSAAPRHFGGGPALTQS
jgi:hypothetical protein